VSVAGEEVLNGLLASHKEQGGRLHEVNLKVFIFFKETMKGLVEWNGGMMDVT
jgi:hypothetical protein